MWTPALGWQMFSFFWSSIFLRESVKGPVALMTHLALTSNSCPASGNSRISQSELCLRVFESLHIYASYIVFTLNK